MNFLTGVKRPNSFDILRFYQVPIGAKRRFSYRTLAVVRNLLISLFIFLFIGICRAATVPPQACHLGNCVQLEVVSKPDDMERGLMYRASLVPNKGMFFEFTEDGKYSFWMKNMKFNLDILWISREGRIVYIGQGVPACSKDPCTVYTPNEDARYVLELNSGYTASYHWKVGDKLNLIGI